MRTELTMEGGLFTDSTTFASEGRWADGSNMRFRFGLPQVIGGWESVVATLLTGVCRAVFNWTDNISTLNIAFGTHQKLQLFQGGALYDITPSSGFTPGQIDGTGQTGYGTGAYGVGGFGVPSATDYFPLTWSLAALGQTLIASPRNQGIFQWSNNVAAPAATIANAPANVTAMIVARDFIFALGCNQEVGGVFNPLCVRHSGVRDPTGWSTIATSASTSREYILPSGGRIVGGIEIGRSILVWTNHTLFLGSYVGQVTKIWQFDKIGDHCGLIGPKAMAALGSTVFWISPDRQFHSYTLGGSVRSIPCPIREDFAQNLAASQGDKIIASTVAEYNEIRWDYPDRRDGYENSRYVALCIEDPDAGLWYRGQMARTAVVDAGPSTYPCGVTFGGNIYWHERGTSADGAPLSWFIETADIYLDEERSFLIKGTWPDIANQQGPVNLTLHTRKYPQSAAGDAEPPETWGPYALSPGLIRKDFKVSGRLVRARYSGSSSPTSARLGRPTFDVKLRGRK